MFCCGFATLIGHTFIDLLVVVVSFTCLVSCTRVLVLCSFFFNGRVNFAKLLQLKNQNPQRIYNFVAFNPFLHFAGQQKANAGAHAKICVCVCVGTTQPILCVRLKYKAATKEL